MDTPLSLHQVQALPATTTLMTAARALGIGRTKAYELAQDGQFPVRLIKIGKNYRVPAAELLHLLGASQGSTTFADPSPPATVT
jgi:excisionase family DNA binding protein